MAAWQGPSLFFDTFHFFCCVRICGLVDHIVNTSISLMSPVKYAGCCFPKIRHIVITVI